MSTTSYSNGYSGLAIADYFVKKALSQNESITNMQVLNMMYFAQTFGFTELHRRLIKDEFYAWQWGPVEPKTYAEFRKYGGQSIKEISHKTNKELDDIESQKDIKEFLDKIYILRTADPFVLNKKTNGLGSPWAETNPYGAIDISLIRNDFIK